MTSDDDTLGSVGYDGPKVHATRPDFRSPMAQTGEHELPPPPSSGFDNEVTKAREAPAPADVEVTEPNKRLVVRPPTHASEVPGDAFGFDEEAAYEPTRRSFPVMTLYDPVLTLAWRIVRGIAVATTDGRRGAENLIWSYVATEGGRYVSALGSYCKGHAHLGPERSEWPKGLAELADLIEQRLADALRGKL